MGEVLYNKKHLTQNEEVDIMAKFTETYKKYYDDSPAIREAMCLKVQFPSIMCKIQEVDLFAGRLITLPIGFSPQDDGGGVGYYIRKGDIQSLLSSSDVTEDRKIVLRKLLSFWEKEATAAKIRAAYPEAMKRALPSDQWTTEPGIAFPLYRMSGSQMDFGRLLEIGIQGMLEKIDRYNILCDSQGRSCSLYEGMKTALDVLKDVCLYYRDQAVEMSKAADGSWKSELIEMARVLESLTVSRPQSFREAIQLVYLYVLLSGSNNFGRMDTYLAEFYVHDVDSGIISEERALELLAGLWKLMVSRGKTFDTRVIVGGLGRKNEEACDRFALLAMEASRIVREPLPQLTLRFYEGMNPKLMVKALGVIGQGRTYPMLYNDDINVPAVMKAFNVSYEEAVDYCPFGCGEYILFNKSFGTPSGVINLLKALEVTLHNGKDPVSNKDMGLKLGAFGDFNTFDDLFNAYCKQVEYYVEQLSDQEELEYKVAGEEAAFLYFSIIFDDCMERGKGMFSGGVRYLGGTLETYGNINTSDSLTAIKQLVYDKKMLSKEELLNAMDADFEGYNEIRKMLLNAPKYGNDDDYADSIAVKVHEHVCNAIRNQKERTSLHSYLTVIINNQANTILGRTTGASADGRKAFTYMANANNPQGGMDKSGVTAMLNSLNKLDVSIHAGSVQNMKFSKEMFDRSKGKLEALLKAYFKSGGSQAMINVLDRNDLINAMKEPEKYQNLIVRVGGFSARFVELDRDVQMEVLSRTIY